MESRNRLVELLSFLDVCDGGFQRALCYAERLSGNAHSAAVQSFERHFDAFADFANQIGFGNYAVFKYKLAGGRAANTHFQLFLAHGKSGEALFHYKRGALHALGIASRDRYDEIHVGGTGVGYEYFAAVEHPVVAFFHRSGCLIVGVRARVRLCQTESAKPLSRRKLRQIFFLLFFVAVLHNRSNAQRGVRGKYNARRGADLGKLLHGFDIHFVISAHAAVLFGHDYAHESELCHLFDGFVRETLLLVNLVSQRLDLVDREIPYHLVE